MKLDSNKDHYEQEFGWVGSPRGGGTDEVSKLLIENRYQLEILGGVLDKEASYSYDEWALVKFKRKYYLLSTSGCSCPSPEETWRVEMGPSTLLQIEKHLESGNYDGYTVPGRQMDEFLELIAKAKGDLL
jgi:hypothetical protein